MKKKHTDGDWWGSSLGMEVLSMPFQVKICGRVSGNNPQEAEANLKLIAAAPKLLESLIELKEELEYKMAEYEPEQYSQRVAKADLLLKTLYEL